MKMTGEFLTEEQIAENVVSFEYIRDDENTPIGIVLLDKDFRIGWSLFNSSHEPKSALKDKGILIALSRAEGVGRDWHGIIGEIMEKIASCRTTEKPRTGMVLPYVEKMFKRREVLIEKITENNKGK